MTIRIVALLGTAFVLAGAADITAWQPQQLVARFPDGKEIHYAATNPVICATAIEALQAGRDRLPEPQQPVTLKCEPGDIFPPGMGKDRGATVTLPELAKQAAAEISRWYGRTERFNAPPQRRVPCDEFLLEHWRLHPQTAPKADQ